MANRLKMAMMASILTLRRQGLSGRRIAELLGIHRETVSRYLRLARAGTATEAELGEAGAAPHPGLEASNPAIAPPGSDVSKPAIAPPGSGVPNPAIAPTGLDLADPQDLSRLLPPPLLRAGPSSRCEPHRAVIAAKLEAGLSAQRIYQDLVAEHAFTGSYYSVRRMVRRLSGPASVPFRRMECAPGQEAQVDFGTGAPIIIPDKEVLPAGVKLRRRRTHVFRIVLSHSRKAYSEAVYRQTTEEFIRCLENAFRHFGGVPRTLVIDNLRAAVTQADWFDPQLNPKVRSFCEHYGTGILPTRPYTPRHKGKIERGIGYVKNNALKGRTFESLADQNRHLREGEQTVADTRIHGTTRRQVGQVFQSVERTALQPLPPDLFPSFTESRRKVNRDGHVEVARAYYSVPPEHLGREVWARWDARVVRIFNTSMQPIAVHARQEPGRFSSQDRHLLPEKISGIERGSAWLLAQVRRVGPATGCWAEAMIENRGIEGVRVLLGLLHLTRRHDAESLERACDVAQTHGAYRLRVIRELLKRLAPAQEQFEFIDRHPIIRSLEEYGQFVQAALAAPTGSAGVCRAGSAAWPGDSTPPARQPHSPVRRRATGT
ncbi:MAG: IS21 family transposase [Planctomycetia bacterium]|nr:IS21 family transposase [Planctomycetia bacterium]